MKPVKPAIVAAITVAVGIAAFFGGMKYTEYRRQRIFSQQFQGGPGGQFRNMQFGGGQGRNRLGGARPVAGEIMSIDDKSVTVKMMDGSSKIVILSGTTIYNKAAEGTKSDLKVGERIAVFGSENSDGSVTAQNVQLNPMIRGMMGSGTPMPSKK